METFHFQLEATCGNARVGTMSTPHGLVPTPIFMPVGTQATVKALDTEDTLATQAPIILANTYHLMLRPGMEVLTEAGGVHEFMHWPRPMLTDSGGFQVFSLEGKVDEDGVGFHSHVDGSAQRLTPERAMELQRQIGADIIMAFDQCTLDNASPHDARAALDRTHRWAKQCVTAWEAAGRQSAYGKYQALFGIVQGAMHRDLREESARFLSALPFDGIAVGGETIGYNMPGTLEVMDWIRSILPVEKPRYAMGLGRDPQNVIDAALAGFDMFDCVAPTRLARNGALYVGELRAEKGSWTFASPYKNGRLNVGLSSFIHDNQVIQPGCDCYTCQHGYTRAYLHHLYRVKELAYYRLASIHNVRFMVRLMQQLRVELQRNAA